LRKISAHRERRGALHAEETRAVVRLNVSEERNGERMDAVHKVRPTLWSVSVFLAVPPFIVETARIVRCSLLHSLWRFLGRMEVGVQPTFLA
jgi:hypothetical protein